MSGSVELADLYASGYSIPDVSKATGVPPSTVRSRLKKIGALRSREDGIRNAAKAGKLSTRKGKPRPPFSDEWKDNISNGRKSWANNNAVGISQKKSGYREITRGEKKGKSEHVAIMEKRLGRALLPDECVHHIDQNRSNNAENNLALMTRSGHTRHHQMIRRIQKWQAL